MSSLFLFLSVLSGFVTGQQSDLCSSSEGLHTSKAPTKALFFQEPADSSAQKPATLTGWAAHPRQPH